MRDHDDYYIEATEQLEGELEREPTPDEVEERASELMENDTSNAADRAKWRRQECSTCIGTGMGSIRTESPCRDCGGCGYRERDEMAEAKSRAELAMEFAS